MVMERARDRLRRWAQACRAGGAPRWVWQWSLVGLVCLLVGTGCLAATRYAAAQTVAPSAPSQRQPLAQGLGCTINDASTGGTLHSGHRSQTMLQQNEQPGTTTWGIDTSLQATTQIQAYASALTVNPGDALNFYVSVQTDGTPYTVTTYRLGWYCGSGAWPLSAASEIGHAQGYYDASSAKLVTCQTCHVDHTTGLVEANWRISYTLNIPSTWPTGLYVARFTDVRGWQTEVTFDVRGNPHSTYLVITPDATVAAYNQWGGYSLYQGPDNLFNDRAYAVSFDRPLAGWGANQGLVSWVNTIRWIERLGYDVSYTSGIDVDEHPDVLLGHRAILSIGHDEYWSKAMRDGMEQARDAGIGLAFLGADTSEWQIRFQPDSAGTPDRTIICYKDASLDPMTGVDNSVVTTEWREPPVSRPENALIGIMFSSYNSSTAFPWHVSASTTGPIPLFQNTGLRAGQTLGCDVVGYEWDMVFDNGSSPPGLVTLATSTTLSLDNGVEGSVATKVPPDTSNTAYYIAPSGAMVFASGTINWGFALDSLRLASSNICQGRSQEIGAIKNLMANVMDAIAVKH
jgi:hypothetical protein